MSQLQKDRKIYHKLIQMDEHKEPDQIEPHISKSAFLLHWVLKLVPIALYIISIQYFAMRFIDSTLFIEGVLIAVVIDFWFTKNITGRKLIGLKWGFQQDQHGIQRFRAESRVNEEYVSGTSTIMFWGVLFLYALIPLALIIRTFIITPHYNRIRLQDAFLNVAILLGALLNIYFFNRARSISGSKQTQLTGKVGKDFMKSMGKASIIAYN